jgi:hypothetical protein
MHSYLFVFFFGQSTGKADKFLYVLNMLDVLRESLILVSGWILLTDRLQALGQTVFTILSGNIPRWSKTCRPQVHSDFCSLGAIVTAIV